LSAETDVEAVAVRQVADVTSVYALTGKMRVSAAEESATIGIRLIEVVAVFIRLAPGENLIVRSFLPFVLQ
jgi:hypothetical protein